MVVKTMQACLLVFIGAIKVIVFWFNLNKNLIFCSTYLPVKDSAQVMQLHTTLIFALFDNELQ